MRPGVRRVPGEEARVAGWIGHRARAVASAARERSARLVMATRARRHARRRQRDPRGCRRCARVTAPARVRIGRVEHRGPARRAQRGPVKGTRSRIGDPGIMHAVREVGGTGGHPPREDRTLRTRQKPAVRRRVERREERSRLGGRQSRRSAGRLDAGDRRKIRRRAPSGGGRRSAVARDAVLLEDGRNVGGEDRGQPRGRPILRARHDDRRARDEKDRRPNAHATAARTAGSGPAPSPNRRGSRRRTPDCARRTRYPSRRGCSCKERPLGLG